MEKTSAGDLGCMVCLLRVALGDENANRQDRHGGFDTRFGNYVVEQNDDSGLMELGRGAMGVTYVAVDTSLQRKVALKIIKTDLAAHSAEARERFMRGARAAAALRHENVATVYHFGIREETGQCFYAMELVEGETLEEHVRRSGPLNLRSTIAIARQVTHALAAAEKQGLVHRDLKPSNLMLIEADEGTAAPKVKVIDFGLAKAIKGDSDPMWLTRDGFVGTPAFASPEQFAHGSVDVRSDIYSLGVTLWFALTGKTPFRGHNVEEIRRAQQSQLPPVDQLRAARVPLWMISLLKSMLAIEPAARPDLESLAERLRRGETAPLRSRLILAGTFVVLAAALIFFWRPSETSSSKTKTTPLGKSIAVLPFNNLSQGEPDSVYFVDGIRAQITARLSRIGSLELVSDSSTERFKGVQPDVSQIATALGVNTVLQGSVQKNGDKFRVDVRLTDARKHANLWSQTYERTFSGIADVESEVPKKVAMALGLKLSNTDQHAIATHSTTNPRAYEAYLKGRFVWLQRSSDGYTQAKRYFEEAIALDPKYAQAYAGLADALQFLGAYDFNVQQRPEYYLHAKQAAEHALQIDPELAEAHASLGLMAMNYDWDWSRADQEFQRALALEPNNPLIHDWYGEYLMATGRAEHAVHEMSVAAQLDPFSILINSDLGKMLYFARHYPEAKEQLSRAIRMDPAFDQPRMWMGYLLTTTGDFEEAINLFEKLWPVGRSNWQAALLGYTYGMAGKKSEAQQMLELVKNPSQHGGYADKLPVVWAYLGVGDNDRALACLEQDCQAHSTTVAGLRSLPWFDPLRADPRFVDLMRRVHLSP